MTKLSFYPNHTPQVSLGSAPSIPQKEVLTMLDSIVRGFDSGCQTVKIIFHIIRNLEFGIGVSFIEVSK